jgi:hypothetical protein
VRGVLVVVQCLECGEDLESYEQEAGGFGDDYTIVADEYLEKHECKGKPEVNLPLDAAE